MNTIASQPRPSRLLSALGLSLLALVGANSAHAATNNTQDFYVGATLGVDVVAARNYEVDNRGYTKGRTSGGLFLGARITDIKLGQGLPLYMELGYQNIARSEIIYKVGARSSVVTAKGNSLYAAGKLDIPLTENFSLFTRLGVARNKVSSSTPAGAPAIDLNGSKYGLLTGVGVQWNVGSNLTLRGDFTNYGKASKNAVAGGLNLGVAYRF